MLVSICDKDGRMEIRCTPQREVRPQTRSLDCIEIVEESHCILFREKRSRQEAAVTAFRGLAFIVVLSGIAVLWVIHLLHCSKHQHAVLDVSDCG